MKITFGLITLNAGFFLKQVLESIYPFAHKIIIADGAVTWWRQQGVNGSTDDTIDIIKSFPDPDNKILLVRCGNEIVEKDDQCRAWFAHVPADTDYVFCVDSDEVHSPDNIETLIKFLEKEQPTSVGFKSDSFFGGFERIIGGFERDHSFKRVLKYVTGCYYRTHRQPTLSISLSTSTSFDQTMKVHYSDIQGKDITGNHLYAETGITMWHGSYVSPVGVHNKIRYYEGAVIAKGQCIPDYFNSVWIPWVKAANYLQKMNVEKLWNGVHEFMPSARGECYTEPYTGVPPPSIVSSMPELLTRFDKEFKLFI